MSIRAFLACAASLAVVAAVRAQVELVTKGHTRVLYVAGAQDTEVLDLYSADLQTGQILRMTGPSGASGWSLDHTVDATSKHVVWLDGPSESDSFTLMLHRSRLKDGSSILLTDPAAESVERWELDPRGKYAVSVVFQKATEAVEIHRARISDGQQLVLNPPLVEGGNVDPHFDIDPRGRYVLYTADAEVDETHELYRADLKTGAVLKLNDPLPAGGSAWNPQRIQSTASAATEKA